MIKKQFPPTISVIKGAVFIFLPLAILASGVIFVLYLMDLEKNIVLTQRHTSDHNNLLQEVAVSELKLIVSDLLFLAQHSIEYQEHRTTHHQNESIYDAEVKYYEGFSKNRKIYDNIRFLDVTGKTLLQIYYHDGDPKHVPKSKLPIELPQNFAVMNQLIAGKVSISPLTLNVIDEKVEQPLKPLIQFSTPIVDDKGQKIGIVLVDYLMNRLFQHFDRISMDAPGNVFILTKTGEIYWTKSEDPEDEQSFMMPERVVQKIQTTFPQEWQKIATNLFGQFTTENGLFTFLTIQPNLLVESNISFVKQSNLSDLPKDRLKNNWKIVSHVPPHTLFAGSWSFFKKLVVIYILLMIVVAIGSLALSFANRRRALAEQHLREEFNSYSRFVPLEFLKLLEKDHFSEVKLADHIQEEMTIFFSDIRSYTKLSETMSPIETFNFLNSYFKQISPPIKKFYGFIDKFIGDAVMAIFPNPDSPYHALSSVIALKRQLDIYNQSRKKAGYAIIQVGFGLHYGEVTLGAVGSLDRMDTTVIGDTVNLASRLESLTKVFKVDIILSDDVYTRLPPAHGFHLREIDTVRVKGKEQPVILYEAFDTNDQILIEKKQATVPLFQQGIALYKTAQFQEAMTVFSECHTICPEDPLPPIYIKRCNALFRVPPGAGWAGISTL